MSNKYLQESPDVARKDAIQTIVPVAVLTFKAIQGR